MHRRQFLAAASGALVFPFIACARKTDPPLPPVAMRDAGLELGHRLRDGTPFPEPRETVHVPVLIVGAGIGGLSAAWRLQKRGFDEFQMVELADRPGGNSSYADATENPISPHPFGAHYLPLPTREAVHVRELLADLGAIDGDPQAVRPLYDERRLCHAPQERLYRDGIWQDGLIPHLGLGRAERDQIARFLDRMAEFRAATDAQGRRAFALPADLSSPDPRWRQLDQLTMTDWMRGEGFVASALHWYVDYACRDDYGTRAGETSAWAGIHYFACRNGEAANAPADAVLTSPEGNGWIVGALRQRVGQRLLLQAMVFRVRNSTGGFAVDVFFPQEGFSRRYHCRHLVWAAPALVLARVAAEPPAGVLAALSATSYAPWLVANLSLAEAPRDGAGAPLAWDNVPYGSPGLGYVVATHQNLRQAPGATVLTWYWALAHEAPAVARQSLLANSREQWARWILAELSRMHPDLPVNVRRIDLFRYGHAMIRPVPGALWGGRREALLRLPSGLHFAHADASGLSLFEEANYRGVLAADRILHRLG